MNLLMIGGDQSILKGEQGPYWYTLQDLSSQFTRIDVFCSRVVHPVLNPNEPIHGNVYFHPCPVHKALAKRWIQTYARTLHATIHFDCITVHAYPPFIHFLAGRYLQKQLAIPVVCEWHGVHSFTNGSSLQDRIGAILTAMFAKKSNAFTSVRTVSSTVTAALEQYGVLAAKTTLLPAVYINSAVWSCTAQKPQYDIVFCGRIDANKRLDRIIQALAQMPEYNLVIIGDGPQKSACVQLATSLGVQARITWLGWLKTPAEVAAIVGASKVLCMPSGYEGGPRVVVEALSAGVPVVATRVGIVPDVLKHGVNGLYTSGTVPTLVQDITTVVTTPAIAESARREASVIAQRFARRVLINEYVQWLKGSS